MILGDAGRAEMRPLVAWLEQAISPSSQRVFADSIEVAVNGSQSEPFPDLIIVLHGWPDEYSRGDVSRLFAFAPLARIVVCYGSWCESDGRNHNLWPQSVRVPLWAAKARIEREWRLIQNPGELQPLPWSASREEVFAADHPCIGISTQPSWFAVESPDPEYQKSLIEIMTEAGHVFAGEHPCVILFDADPWGASRASALRGIRNQFSNAMFVALLSLPTSTLADELREFGVTSVVQKLGFRESLLAGRSQNGPD